MIELLVVISIVALLISLLLPALERARQQTQILKCAAQLHQIQMGSTSFAVDHDGKLIGHPGLQPANGGPANIAWDDNAPHFFQVTSGTADDVYFLPYFDQSKELFFCPSHPTRADGSGPEWWLIGWGWPSPLGGVYDKFVMTTLINLAHVRDRSPDPKPHARTIDDSGDLPLWTDNSNWNERGGGDDPGSMNPPFWQSINHPPGYYGRLGDVEADGTAGRNLATVGGSVTFDYFDEVNASKYGFMLETIGGGQWVSF